MKTNNRLLAVIGLSVAKPVKRYRKSVANINLPDVTNTISASVSDVKSRTNGVVTSVLPNSF
jgi:hypothetical protein